MMYVVLVILVICLGCLGCVSSHKPIYFDLSKIPVSAKRINFVGMQCDQHDNVNDCACIYPSYKINANTKIVEVDCSPASHSQ